ncbi:MAG TPA: hypothetical protein VNS49_22710 [Streptomyces sp.]|nr:hypothetical protein [Streptomyces sp.]
MNVPLGKDSQGPARRPTQHQLEAARIRARTTGESLAHVLSVFMGEGRDGTPEDADEPPGAAADSEQPTAPVIPLSRARRSTQED